MSTNNKILDENELAFAREIIMDKMKSLKKDVEHCLKYPYAPMPAMLWCLSCIDLLGALLAGQAAKKIPGTNKNVKTTENSRNYMRTYMDYTPDQTELILEVFRHKLVHLAQPAPLSSYNNKTIVWKYDHVYNPSHLVLENLDHTAFTEIRPGWREHVDQRFTLGITQFMEDIRKSVFKDDGYLVKLETDSDLQTKCWNAIKDIYTPQEIKIK